MKVREFLEELGIDVYAHELDIGGDLHLEVVVDDGDKLSDRPVTGLRFDYNDNKLVIER